jgi:hypothetical protein
MEGFRAFLSSHRRTGKNKKLELFDHLVHRSADDRPVHLPDQEDRKSSRQSVSQLKKRLQEDLYSFLISQHQSKNYNDPLVLEMDCHKKLYCFKILFDKGVHDHAYGILEQVLNISVKHSLHSLYLEAISLKNIYFPSIQGGPKRKVLVNTRIKSLKQNISRSLYVNQYLSDSRASLFDDDTHFRRKLMNELAGFELTENEYVLDHLMEVNRSFYLRDFESAYDLLMELAETDECISGDASILGLIYIELAKVCICLSDPGQAMEWVCKAELLLEGSESFVCVLLELRFIIAFRFDDMEAVTTVLEQAGCIKDLRDNEVLTARWSLYTLFLNFQKKEFKAVIKAVNAGHAAMLKNKNQLYIIKILEIFSIGQLEDSDWFHYKIESLRKLMGGEGKQPRFNQVVNLIRGCMSGKKLSPSDVEDRIIQIEKQYPWHPLGCELFDFCSHLREMQQTDTSVSLASTQ